MASHCELPHERLVGSHERPSCVQSTHVPPNVPHAAESVPARQVEVPFSNEQHPPGHCCGPQLVTVRPQVFFPSQNWKPFATQSEQRWPNEPHARVSDPTRHTPAASQQPFVQFEGPQLFGVTIPPSGGVSISRLDRPQPGATSTRNNAPNRTSAAAGLTKRDTLESEGRRIRLAFRIQRSGTARVPVASPSLLDSFAYLGIPIFQRALLAGSVLAALLALLGVLVTARGLAYLGDGLSHAAFGGIALGMFLGLSSPLAIAIPFTALAAIAIGAMRRRGGLRSDVAMAILFAVCFAAGIVLLRKAKRTEQTFDPEQLLFGNILLVGSDDLWVVLGIAAVTLAFVVFAWTRIAYATFDEELARLSGIEVGWLESMLLALLAAVIVAAIRLAGVVLVSAFLVIPAAAGRLIGRSLTGVVGWAMLTGIVGVGLGFVVAHRLEWPEGAAIVLLLAAMFAGAAGWRRVRG